MSDALFSSGREFASGATGRWAGERFLQAIREGRPISANELRTCDTLPRDVWIAYEDALVEEGLIRLKGIADLIEAGLTRKIPNALGKTMFQFERIGDMEDAVISMDGLARSDNDRVDFNPENLPLPIIHKDFDISIRTLEASRNPRPGSTAVEALDDTQIRVSGRKVYEMQEKLLFQGGPTYGGATIYGYTNHPDRITSAFGTNGNWAQAAKTGENMLSDILTGVAALESNGFYGPYWVYLPGGYGVKVAPDFKANSDKSIMARLMEVNGIEKISVVDQMPANNIVIVQASKDVVTLLDGEPVQTVQWDIYGGFAVAMKVFAIQVPLIRSTSSGKSGVFHMS